MPQVVVCPSCDAKMKAPDDLAGRSVRCPRCKHAVIVPGEPAAAPAPAAKAVPPSRPSAEVPRANAAAPPAIVVSCPGCGKRLGARPASAGKAVKCPGCGKAVPVPGPAAPAPAPAPPPEDDYEWIDITEAATPPPGAAVAAAAPPAPAPAAAGGASGDWGEELLEEHDVPDDTREEFRAALTRGERLLWFDRPQAEILLHRARMFQRKGAFWGFLVCAATGGGAVFAAIQGVYAFAIVLPIFTVVFGAIGVFALGAPARQRRNAARRACYALTNRRLLVHPGNGSQSFDRSGSSVNVTVNLGGGAKSPGIVSYSGLELSRMQRLELKRFPGAGDLILSRNLYDEASGGWLQALGDVLAAEKRIRETLLHPVIDKLLRGELLSRDEKGKAGDAAEAGASAVAPDGNIKDYLRGAAAADDPNVKDRPAAGRVPGFDPAKLPEDTREKVEAELTAGERLVWAGKPERGTKGRGVMGAVTGGEFRMEPEYTLYALTNRRALLWAEIGSRGTGTSILGKKVDLGSKGPSGPVSYYPPHLRDAGLEEDTRIKNGGSIVFKVVKRKIVTQKKQGGTSTRVEMHHFGFLRIRDYKGVARLLYETLLEPSRGL